MTHPCSLVVCKCGCPSVVCAQSVSRSWCEEVEIVTYARLENLGPEALATTVLALAQVGGCSQLSVDWMAQPLRALRNASAG